MSLLHPLNSSFIAFMTLSPTVLLTFPSWIRLQNHVTAKNRGHSADSMFPFGLLNWVVDDCKSNTHSKKILEGARSEWRNSRFWNYIWMRKPTFVEVFTNLTVGLYFGPFLWLDM